MKWCGADGGTFWSHFTILPCWFESLTSPLVLCLAIFVAVSHIRRIKCLAHCGYCQHASSESGKAAASKVLFCCVVLGITHSAGLIFLVASQAGYVHRIVNETLLLTAWAVVTATLVRGINSHVTLHSQMLMWPALIMYLYDTYIYLNMYIGGWATTPRDVILAGLILSAVRLLLCAVAVVFDLHMEAPSDEERALKEVLLGYDVEAPKEDGKQGKRKRSWFKIMGTALLYVWPKDPFLQLRGVLCVLIIIFVRVMNLAVPILYKHVVDTMSWVTSQTHPTGGQEHRTFGFMEVFSPWVLLYIIAYFFQGGSGGGAIGLLSNLRQYLWIPITQAAYRQINLDVFVHVLDLDLNYHLHRKTGEVMRIMDRGTGAMQSILSVVAFSILPQMFDIVAACVYIASALELWVAVIVFVTLFSYIPITIVLTEWRGQFRRDLNQYDNAKGAKATDALLNYETVKYFNNEDLEQRNFSEAINNYQGVEYKLLASLNILNIVQSLIIFLGMASGLVVCTRGVAHGSLTVGDTVLFLTMMTQLYAPLNFFGSYYRTIQQYMIDMENMFDLLAQHPQIQDKPDAQPLALTDKTVEFDNVWFSYNDTTAALKGVTFSVPGGCTMALVGSTGSGKSTVLRLLWRFYGCESGAVMIDKQNITDITLKSLRSSLGMVPQDAVLFNDTIRYNIRYGKPDATDEEVEAAASAAAIHQIITDKFPKGYDTVVGERGLRLSGGEKQRVAIARAILKNAPILLLDEATSALDSITEKNIQAAVANLRSTRTTIIVAHRLSTVMDADIITVLKDGTVAESGSHPELVSQEGIYAEMWSRQKEAADFDRPQSFMSLASATGSASGT